ETTTGKESSNSFMAGSLPKTILHSFLHKICFHMSPFEFTFVYLVVTSIESPYLHLMYKQFWNTASVKRSGDVTRLQALVDKKKIVISKAVIHEILQLNDAEGIVCLPNEEIFAGLAQMGYEKPSTKLTFYKAFFSSQ
nr:hypothetical protein [Tanacetum cinerariifolium]